MQRVLITGATGYIGSNVARYLLSKGYTLDIITRPASKLGLISDIAKNLRIHTYCGDINELIKIFSDIKPYAVIHLAALFVAEHRTEDICPMLESNVVFGTQLLEAAVKCETRYFINTGTYWQNYNGDSYNPVNLYASTKQAFECISKYYLETSQLRMLTIKLIDTYGPFDPRSKIMTLFKRVAENGDKLDMSPGDQELGLVYIDDVVRGFMNAFEIIQEMRPHESKSFILAPEKFYCLKDVAAIFEKIYRKPLNISWGKRAYRRREMMKINTKETNILSESIDLPAGIKLMHEIENGIL